MKGQTYAMGWDFSKALYCFKSVVIFHQFFIRYYKVTITHENKIDLTSNRFNDNTVT